MLSFVSVTIRKSFKLKKKKKKKKKYATFFFGGWVFSMLFPWKFLSPVRKHHLAFILFSAARLSVFSWLLEDNIITGFLYPSS